MAIVKVTDSKFVRDTKSMALINTDVTEKNEYIAKVRMLQSQKSEINNIRDEFRNELSELNKEIQELKDILLKILKN